MAELLVDFAKNFPLLSIMVFSFIITIFFLLAYKKFTNQRRMKELREKTAELRNKAKGIKDPKELMEINKEMMSVSTEQLRISMKPMLFTAIPFLLAFSLLKDIYIKAGVGDIIVWNFSLPVIGTGAGWLLSYIIFSITFNSIFRKVFKIY